MIIYTKHFKEFNVGFCKSTWGFYILDKDNIKPQIGKFVTAGDVIEFFYKKSKQ